MSDPPSPRNGSTIPLGPLEPPLFHRSHPGGRQFESGAETNRQLLEAAGLIVVLSELVLMKEPEREVAFLWVWNHCEVSWLPITRAQ